VHTDCFNIIQLQLAQGAKRCFHAWLHKGHAQASESCAYMQKLQPCSDDAWQHVILYFCSHPCTERHCQPESITASPNQKSHSNSWPRTRLSAQSSLSNCCLGLQQQHPQSSDMASCCCCWQLSPDSWKRVTQCERQRAVLHCGGFCWALIPSLVHSQAPLISSGAVRKTGTAVPGHQTR